MKNRPLVSLCITIFILLLAGCPEREEAVKVVTSVPPKAAASPGAKTARRGDDRVAAVVGDREISLRFLKEMKRRYEKSPAYKGPEALLRRYVNDILLAGAADKQGVPRCETSRLGIPLNRIAYYKEFLEGIHRPLVVLGRKYPVVILPVKDKLDKLAARVASPEDYGVFGKKARGGMMSVLTVAGRAEPLYEVWRLLTPEEKVEFIRGGSRARHRFIDRHSERAIYREAFKKMRGLDYDYTGEREGAIIERFRALDMLVYEKLLPPDTDAMAWAAPLPGEAELVKRLEESVSVEVKKELLEEL